MGIFEILRGEEPGPIKKLLNFHNKGQFGEYLIEYAITSPSIPGNFFVFHSLYVPYRGKYAEIDLVMLHEQGIFVFESKNYSGRIFGNEADLYWTQCLSNGEKYRFYNPIRQNLNHIKALSSFLQLPLHHFYSCIVFSEHCILQAIPLFSDEYAILQRADIVKWLQGNLQTRQILYSHQKLSELAQLLSTVAEVDEDIKQSHVNQIVAQRMGLVCPYCGSPLVLRHGKYGDFWGCSSYPKCQFTRNYHSGVE